jgi:hypothetical protein
MRLSGFADEAADGIDGQIEVTRALGWSFIEARSIDRVNIHDLSEPAFDEVRRKLDASGIRINCFGSTIANWSKGVDEPFEETLATVDRAIRRMQVLDVPYVRIMSYAILEDDRGRALADQKKEERFRRLREICARFLDVGITPVHENCFNFGGMSWEHSPVAQPFPPQTCFRYRQPGLAGFPQIFPIPIRCAILRGCQLSSIRQDGSVSERRKKHNTGQRRLRGRMIRGPSGWLRQQFSIEPHMAVVFTMQTSRPRARSFENYLGWPPLVRLLDEVRHRIKIEMSDEAAMNGACIPSRLICSRWYGARAGATAASACRGRPGSRPP